MSNLDHITRTSCVAVLRQRFRGLWHKYREEQGEKMRASRAYCRREMACAHLAIKVLQDPLRLPTVVPPARVISKVVLKVVDLETPEFDQVSREDLKTLQYYGYTGETGSLLWLCCGDTLLVTRACGLEPDAPLSQLAEGAAVLKLTYDSIPSVPAIIRDVNRLEIDALFAGLH